MHSCQKMVINQAQSPTPTLFMLNGNPILGYNKQKADVKLMFWTYVDFD